MEANISGCYPALITPFEKGEDACNYPINYEGMDELLKYVLNRGVDGVVVAGCTGSASLLSHDEQVKLVRYVNENYGGITKVIAGDGSNSTKEAVKLTQRIEEEAEVNTHLSISPYYNKPSDKGILKHYTKIADNIEGELILYSVPGRTAGKGIMPDVAEELANHPNIIGIKEASGNIERIKETIERTKDKDFFVISGDDPLTREIIKYGGVGAISVVANVAPLQTSEMINCCLKGYDDLAQEADRKLSPLYPALFPSSEGNAAPNPVMCHYALKQIGIPAGVPRLPLTEGSNWEKTYMDLALIELELI